MFAAAALALVLSASPAPALSPLPAAMAKGAMPMFTARTSQISVKAGAPFQIRLDVTSGTGYTWAPQALPPGLTLLGNFQTPRGTRMPGGRGQQVLVFRAADVGSLKLTLRYSRPWERGAKPAKVQTFELTVHK
jgi:predicted secreted protein